MTNHLRLVTGDGAAPTGVRLDDSFGLVSHRDIGHIAVTDIDGITINRTKSGISPFVPILKTPTYSRNSGTHSGYAVEIEDASAPTGYTHVGNVSQNYLLLSNEEVRDLAVEIAFQSGIPFKESRIFWDGARFAHIIDFTESEEVAPGDAVGLSLITRSSYDKSWKYDCALMGKRFLCDNGALSGEFFALVSFKHVTTAGDPKEATWRDVVRQGMSVIDRAPDDLHSFARSLRAMKGARIDGRTSTRDLAGTAGPRRRRQGADHEPVRRARGADGVRALQRRDVSVLAPSEDDRGGLLEQRRVHDGAAAVGAGAAELTHSGVTVSGRRLDSKGAHGPCFFALRRETVDALR